MACSPGNRRRDGLPTRIFPQYARGASPDESAVPGLPDAAGWRPGSGIHVLSAPHPDAAATEGGRVVGEEIADLGPLSDALAAAMLPVGDLHRPGRRFFGYRAPQGAIVGYGGFELHGADALLRSVVVLPGSRGRGIGGAILAHLAEEARAAGASTAFLVTTTAAAFFERHGFRAIDRLSAPTTILGTAQVAEICAATAPLLMRRLDRPS